MTLNTFHVNVDVNFCMDNSKFSDLINELIKYLRDVEQHFIDVTNEAFVFAV